MECCGKAAAFVLRTGSECQAFRSLGHVCQTRRIGSQVASLARFGKPSDYGAAAKPYGVLRQSRSFRAANLFGTSDLSPARSRLPNTSHRFTSRFARSVWKTERLWCCGGALWSAAAKPYGVLRQSRSFRAANLFGTSDLSPARSRLPNTSHRFTSRFARSVWKTERLWCCGFALWSAAAEPQLSCCEPVRNVRPFARSVTFAKHVASVHKSLRSLGLENRATMVLRLCRSTP